MHQIIVLRIMPIFGTSFALLLWLYTKEPLMADNDDDDTIPTDRFFSPEPEDADSNISEQKDVSEDISLMINGQYTKDLSFEAPNAPDVFPLLQNEIPSIEVNIDVEANPKGDKIYEVALKVRAEAQIQEQLVYLCEVIYAGLFTVNVAKEQIGPVLLIECPLIIFPFLRRIVADLTGDGGFAPLMLAPIDFASLYQQRMLASQDNKQEV